MKLGRLIATLFFLALSETAFTADPYNYSELWRSWSVTTREAYIDGVVDGISEAFILTIVNVAREKLMKKPEPPEVKRTRDNYSSVTQETKFLTLSRISTKIPQTLTSIR